MRAYLDAMDAVEYRAPLPPEPVPRVLAALRPRMLELARDRTAGAHPYFVSVAHTARAGRSSARARSLAPEQAVLLEDRPRARPRDRARLHAALPGLPNYVNTSASSATATRTSPAAQRPAGRRDVAWGDEEAIARSCARASHVGATTWRSRLSHPTSRHRPSPT